MIRFDCDYTEGAHPKILQKLLDTNMVQTCGYGLDEYCEHARQLIKEACGTPSADVHFIVGGTQTNTIVISSILKPYQGVFSADTGHINVHETGAIEATGHKVLALPNCDGKITGKQVEEATLEILNSPTPEHIVEAGMIYISQPTESGTLYTKQELMDLHAIAKKYHLPLFIDGARLGYALACQANDATLMDLAENCDVFYIGGTKVGALFGEAVVICNPELKRGFRNMMKRQGALLAKGRLLGIQFETLFTDNLYFEISAHAMRLANRVKQACLDLEIPLFAESCTNQQFPIFTNEQLEKLKEKYVFSPWEKVDECHQAVRICTCWATTDENINALIDDLKNL